VLDSFKELHTWRLPDGSDPGMGALPFADDEVCPPNACADLDSVEPDFEEATGNEGASFERLYQRAALVLWPRQRRAAALADGNVDASVPYLNSLLARAEQAEGAAAAALRQQAGALADAIRAAWPATAHAREHASKAGHGAALLEALTALGDSDGAAAYIEAVVAGGGYGTEDNAAIVRALAGLAPARAADLVHAVMVGNAARAPAACAQLLARCAEPPLELSAALLHPSALVLVAALPDTPEPPRGFYGEPDKANPELVLYALVALSRVDIGLAEQALAHCLARPTLFDPDRVLLPAALIIAEVHGDAAEPKPPALERLRLSVLHHLEARIAEPLAPPADWRRPAEIRCNCADCAALNRFLADADAPTWSLKAAEAKRRHVEASIQQARADVDTRTEARGRPFTLVCSKNQASYERRVAQRKTDLVHRERLLHGASSGG